jgi:geranylgeranylglycerol-phosphate geranylgeranyltransferase
MMGFAVIVGAALANPKNLGGFGPSLVYGFVAGFALTAAAMAMNDYYDREIDAVNEPSRPIPSGVIKPKEALVLAGVLTCVGFVASVLTNLVSFLIALFAWTVLIVYVMVGKRSGLPGNFLVSTCVAIPFVYGSAIVATITLNMIFFVSMVFLSITGREITKGIVDVQGDKAHNAKTLAVRFGEKQAAVAAILFYVSAVLISPAPWFLNLVSFWFVPLVIVTDLGLVASSVTLLRD